MTDDTTTETPDEAARLTADVVAIATDADGKRLKENQERQERRNRRAETEKARRVVEGECDQTWCGNPASRNGKCDDCWAATFGSVQ